MHNTKKYNGVIRHTSHGLFRVAFIIMVLLSLASVKAAFGAEMNGVVREMPGISWPYGTWYLEDKRVQVTEGTVFKGDQRATFGNKIIAKGHEVDGVFVATEIEVRVDDHSAFASN